MTVENCLENLWREKNLKLIMEMIRPQVAPFLKAHGRFYGTKKNASIAWEK